MSKDKMVEVRQGWLLDLSSLASEIFVLINSDRQMSEEALERVWQLIGCIEQMQI